MTRHSLRKLAPNDQLEKVKLLRTLMDALPDCIRVKDLEGHYLFNNAAQVKKLGAASPEEVVGKTDFDFDPEELAER
jgi:PAS domain-containing protein